MRNRLVLCTAMLLLSATGVARAQQAAAARDTTMSRWLDLGYRNSTVDGDKARWERYRDMRNGLVANMGFSKETDKVALGFSAANIGYHDQQYQFDVNSFGSFKLNAGWNSTPLNYGYNTVTPWKDQGNNVWTLDAATRAQVQAKTLPAGFVGIGSTAAQYALPSVYRALATTFPMQARRDAADVGLNYRLSSSASLDVAIATTKKSGNMPYGVAFAFNNGNELPMAIDNRTNDVNVHLEWAKANKGVIRVGYTGSWFTNQFQSLTWDNPLIATDYTNGKAPPLGPYDPSGYSNGNGPARGRLALPPSNSLGSLSAFGMYKLPSHTTVNGQLAFTTMKQDEQLIPWTTNSQIANSAVYALFPHLATLPRQSAEAEVKGINAQFAVTTKPMDNVAIDLRYRYNDHKNNTPHFDAVEYVRFDAVPEETGSETEQFNIKRNTVEAGLTYSALRNTSLRVSYIIDDVKRTGRAFSDMKDNSFRVSMDTYGNQYLTLRGVFENTSRKGDGFSEASLEEGGAQPGLRFYDEADKEAKKGTLILQVTPNEKFDLGFSLATGKDEYKGEGFEFGLLDSKNTSYTFSVGVYPTDKVTLGGNYGWDKFKSNQKSRNANPPSTPLAAYESWLDPNRDWYLDNDETVKNAGLFLDLIKVLPKTDIKFSYDYSSSDNGNIYSGPRIVELSTNTVLPPVVAQTGVDTKPCATGLTSCFLQFPNVTNKWTQVRVDLVHMFRPKLGVGVSYWYEKLEITDWANTDNADGSVRIDPLGSLNTGYGNRPYTGRTGMVRLIYTY